MSEDNNIENNKQEEENFLFGKNKELPFTVPVRYFDSLSARIINKIECAEELSELSTLATIIKQIEFVVPVNYFASAENEIEYKAELEELSVLSKINKPVLNTLPEAYINSLKESITNKVELADELRAYATLYAMDKQNNYVVSANYFDSVADRIKEKVHSKSQPQVSIIDKILFVIFKPKFAMAFGVAIIIGVSGIIYINQNKTVIDNGDCKTLACLEKREMLNEHTVREMDDADLYEMVDVDKLDKQIENTATVDSTAVKQNKK